MDRETETAHRAGRCEVSAPFNVAHEAFRQSRQAQSIGREPTAVDFSGMKSRDERALHTAGLRSKYSELRKLVQAAINNGALVSGHADSAALCRAVGRAEV